jgi:hypothetical protein
VHTLIAFGVVALLIWLLWTSMVNPRRISPSQICSSKLRWIWQSMQLYAADHGGRYPDRLADLILSLDLPAATLVCPSSGDTPAAGSTNQAVVADLSAGGHLSYIYLGTGLGPDVPADAVLVFEPLSNHDGAGMNVLLGDGTVEWLDGKQARDLLQRMAQQAGVVRRSFTPVGRAATAPGSTAPAAQHSQPSVQ